jgi:hypothetical protein
MKRLHPMAVSVSVALFGAAALLATAAPAGDPNDPIFADGFDPPRPVTCGWDTALGTPGGSLNGIGRWGADAYAGGSAGSSFNGVSNGVARIDLAAGTTQALGTTSLSDGFVTDFVSFDPGDGEKLYVVGSQNGISFGGAAVPNTNVVFSWDGTTAGALAGASFPGLTFGWSGLVYKGRLAIGGTTGIPQFPLLALWDGSSWETHSEGFEGLVAPIIMTMVEYRGDLYVGGRFDRIRLPDGSGGEIVVESKNVMGFDGSGFFSVGGGVKRATSNISQVQALAVFEDALYIGGRFDASATDNVPMFAVARWDGTTLSAVGHGFPMPSEVRDFEVYDDGSGPALYAVGTFTADTLGTPIRRFAKLQDGDWVEVAGGTGDNPNKAMTLPDGRLAIAGSFSEVGAAGVTGTGPASGLAVLSCEPDPRR